MKFFQMVSVVLERLLFGTILVNFHLFNRILIIVDYLLKVFTVLELWKVYLNIFIISPIYKKGLKKNDSTSVIKDTSRGFQISTLTHTGNRLSTRKMKRSGTGPAAKRQGDVISDTVLCLLAYKRSIRVGGVRISRPTSPPSPSLALSIPRYIRATSVCRDGNAPDNSISRFRTRESESKTDEINLLPLVKPAGVFKLNYASPGSPIRFHARRKRIFTNVPDRTVCIIAGGAPVDGVWRLGYLEVADLFVKRNPGIYNVLFLAKFVITALYFGFIAFFFNIFNK